MGDCARIADCLHMCGGSMYGVPENQGLSPQMARIIGFCNPLLDISCRVSEEFLQKYGLQANDAVLAGPRHCTLLGDLSGQSLFYSAGGAGQNAMRAAQWLLPPGSVGYMGAVGADGNADILQQAAEADGLAVSYMKVADAPTGTCICLLTKAHRSLVASLNAATRFDSSHLEANMDALRAARAFYISGFLLSDSFSVPKFLSDFAAAQDKEVYMNLSAPFICEYFNGRLAEVVASCSVLFGNEAEARALAKAASFSETHSIELIATELAMWKRPSGNRPRLVVITQGSEPTVCYDNHLNKVVVVNVPEMRPEDIVDTNGAGDSFVGAFIAQHLLGKSVADCINAGHVVAQVVIQQSGIAFPSDRRPSF